MKTIKNIALALVLLTSSVTAAQTLTYNFNDPFTSDIVPYGNDPWLSVVLTEVDDYTRILIASGLQDPTEFFGKLAFSLNSNYDYSSFSYSSQHIFISEFDMPLIVIDENGFNVGGAKFDMVLSFETSNSQEGLKRFNGNDKFIFDVNIPFSSFQNVDTPSAIVHVQGIGNNDQSTWLVPNIVPEPGTPLVFGIGVLLLLNRRNRYA